ncbi:MAG: SDR family oxidoreductase [Bacteroidota bacterium]
MLLKNKVAVIYGAAGAIGTAVAHSFANQGASLFLAGRTLETLEALAKEINLNGGKAAIAQVDALDKTAVEDHLKTVMQKAGRIDISFNLIAYNDRQGNALTEMVIEDYATPIANAMHTHFITGTAAARYMSTQGSGVILALTANAGRKPYTHSGGFGVACAAIEAYCRQLAAETGKDGVRVVCLRSAGSPDTPGVQNAIKKHADKEGVPVETFEKNFAAVTMLKRLPLAAEIANTAALAASDLSSAITAAVINVTCGEIAD